MTANSKIKTWPDSDWTYDELVELKQDKRIVLCFPCRDESATIGSLVARSHSVLMQEHPLLDEILVLDDRSTDDSALIAAESGARVVSTDEIHPGQGYGRGKGNVLWCSLLASDSDLVVWCDADLTSFTPDWVANLVWPLLSDDRLNLVKARYDRPEISGGGGRTTELAARPILSLLYPDLASMAQPLGGEYAVRRSAVETISFSQGWGVEIGMMIDLANLYGVETLAQVDLGVRTHNHQSLEALSIQAAEVTYAALSRHSSSIGPLSTSLIRPDGTSVPLNVGLRPPAISLGGKEMSLF